MKIVIAFFIVSCNLAAQDQSEVPNSGRLAYSTSARPFGKNHGFFSNYLVFHSVIGGAVINRVDLLMGFTIPLPYAPLFHFIAPKVCLYSTDNLHVASGVIFSKVHNGTTTMGYVLGTFGMPGKSVSVGFGLGKQYNGWFTKPNAFAENPLIMVGGDYAFNSWAALIGEGYFFCGKGLDDDLPARMGITALRLSVWRLNADGGFAAWVVSRPSRAYGFPYFAIAYNF